MADTKVTVNKVFVFKNQEGPVKGTVDFTVGGVVTVVGTVRTGKQGDFVSLPGARKFTAKDGTEKWANDVKFATREVSDATQKYLLDAFNKEVKTSGSTKASVQASDEVPF